MCKFVLGINRYVKYFLILGFSMKFSLRSQKQNIHLC